MWVAKRRIHVLQLARGLENQKKYASSLIDEPAFISGIIPYIIHYVSYRAEATVSPQRFEAEYQEKLLENRNSELILPYLRHHILSMYCENEDDLARILNLESSGSFLDYYETLVSTSQMRAAATDAQVPTKTIDVLNELWRATKDVRLLRVIAQFGYQLDSATCTGVIADIGGYEAFVSGDNARVLSITSKSLVNSESFMPGDILLFTLASLDPAVDEAWDTCYSAYPMIGGLREMLSGERTSKTARDALCRFAWALDGSDISHLLRSVIMNEDNPDPDTCDSATFRYSLIGMGKYHPVQSWWSASFQPMFEMLCSGKEGSTIIGSKCHHACSTCIKRAFENVGKEFLSWECSRQLIRKKAYTQARAHAQLLAISTHPFYRKQSIILDIICLIELEEIERCMETVTDFWLLYPHLSKSLPLVRLMATVTPETIKVIEGNISYPIFCHIFTISSDGSEPFLRSYAAEDFLASNNLSRPSQLRDIAGKFLSKKLLLFLRDVCVEQVMDTWIEFSSSEEVALERVEVCKLLADLNPENNDAYQGEIRDIMRRLTVRKRIAEVEQSKIYIDTESVIEVAKRALGEDYERYLAFRCSGISPEHRKAIERAKNSLIGGNIKEFFLMKFPRNEMSALLEKMVVHLRDEFVSSSQHGLDGYLSVRIRHGTLEGQLRSALEAEFLLTHKCFDSEEYGPNQYWLDRLAYESFQDAETANQAFQEFSSQFDQLVHLIKKDWIQIKKKTEDVGQFDFTLRSPEIDYIATQITEETTLDKFIDLVLDYFVSTKLVPSLKNIRRGIQTEIKPKLNELLTKLQTSIERIGTTYRIQELRSAIGRARTSGQTTLDRISGWLRLAKTEKKEPFSLDEVISISESSVQASCAEFSVIRNVDSYLGDLLIEASLPSFVDVVCLIFDNIVRRSGLADHPQGIVNAVYEEPYICIRVVNEVAIEAATDAKRIRVDEIKADVKSQPFSQSVSKEGGTGFFKVQKILNHDFRPPTGLLTPALDFGFEEENNFYVDVRIPIHSVRQLEEDE